MRVICINDCPTGSINSWTGEVEKNNLITKGKIYNVINLNSYNQTLTYRILCDNGVVNGIAKARFMLLEDQREFLLNSILENHNL